MEVHKSEANSGIWGKAKLEALFYFGGGYKQSAEKNCFV